MKQIIRKGTFETNSSSMHSLVITKKARPYSQWQKNLGYYDCDWGFELFGCCDTHSFERHPFEVLSDPKDKLRYYVAHYIGYRGQTEKIEEVKNFIASITKVSKDKIKITATEDKWGGGEEETYGWAGINDTGEDVFDYIEKNNIPLEEFVMDPRYTVIVDGDEYQEFGKMFLKGLINVDNIEYISSGKDFWLENKKVFSMHYINRFDNDEVFNELMEELGDYSNEYIDEIIIEDFDEYDDYEISQSALTTFATVLECLKGITKTPIKLKLVKNTKKDFEPILKYIDEIIDK